MFVNKAVVTSSHSTHSLYRNKVKIASIYVNDNFIYTARVLSFQCYVFCHKCTKVYLQKRREISEI